jgi:hypothetical protein
VEDEGAEQLPLLYLAGASWQMKDRHRHGLSSDSDCTFCCQKSEFIDHLMVQCVYSREI